MRMLTGSSAIVVLCIFAGVGATAAETVFPKESWNVRLPDELGLNPEKLETFANRVGGDGCIIKDGWLVFRWGNWTGHKDWASAAKPVLSTLLLFAVNEGKLPSVDAKVASAGWPLSEKDSAMTFRNLANMTSGYARGESPGTAWAYNDYAIQLYAKSLERVFDGSLDVVIREKLAPLQFEDGAIFGSRRGGGVIATPRDFARLGWFWLNEGNWNGNQLLPSEYFDAFVKTGVAASLLRTQVDGDDYLKIGTYGGSSDQTQYGPGVYGFNFWFNGLVGNGGERVWPSLPSDAYQANGMWNRDTLTVIPSLKMVVAVRGAKAGKFKPGQVDSEFNQNFKLVADSIEPVRP